MREDCVNITPKNMTKAFWSDPCGGCGDCKKIAPKTVFSIFSVKWLWFLAKRKLPSTFLLLHWQPHWLMSVFARQKDMGDPLPTVMLIDVLLREHLSSCCGSSSNEVCVHANKDPTIIL